MEKKSKALVKKSIVPTRTARPTLGNYVPWTKLRNWKCRDSKGELDGNKQHN